MKNLILMLAAGLMATMTFAAQCAGTTQEGKRCKREAAEGSKYCIGHASQDKSKGEKKLKDDGVEEDAVKKLEADIQKATDEAIGKVDKIMEAKEKEIMTV